MYPSFIGDISGCRFFMYQNTVEDLLQCERLCIVLRKVRYENEK